LTFILEVCETLDLARLSREFKLSSQNMRDFFGPRESRVSQEVFCQLLNKNGFVLGRAAGKISSVFTSFFSCFSSFLHCDKVRDNKCHHVRFQTKRSQKQLPLCGINHKLRKTFSKSMYKHTALVALVISDFVRNCSATFSDKTEPKALFYYVVQTHWWQL
jgi:hypothetical protein